jgi:hypothetical protein
MTECKAYLPLPLDNNQPTHYDQLVPTAVSDPLEAQPDLKRCTIQEELLIWHQRLAHMPFKSIIYIATVGRISTRHAKLSSPKCPSCLVEKATEISCRVKGANHEIRKTTKPGEIISVKQLESSTQGLISQIKGIHYTQRYHFVTMFVDCHPRYTYLHLQRSNSSKENLQAKIGFEMLAKNSQRYEAITITTADF